MRNVIILFFIVLLVACKNDNTNNNQISPADLVLKPDTSAATDPSQLNIPDACAMISDAQLKSILSITAPAPLDIKPANDPSNTSAKSCFFKWEDLSTPNAGVLIQIMTNPVYDEYPEYISNYVSSKLTEGETVLGSDAATRYKKFSSGDVVGAYSFDQSRFYWSFGNDYLFMLAFNVSTLSEDKMLAAAKSIISEIQTNFAAQK